MTDLTLGRDALVNMSVSQRIAYARKLMLDSGQDSQRVSKTLEAFASWSRETQLEFCLNLANACASDTQPVSEAKEARQANQPSQAANNGHVNAASPLMFDAAGLAAAIAPHLPSQELDLTALDNRFNALSERTDRLGNDLFNAIADVEAKLNEGKAAAPQIIQVLPLASETPSFEGLAHRQFQILLNLVNANIPVWIYGGAGNGKTKAIADVAKALNLDYCNVVLPELCDPSELFGYRSVTTGEYIASLFRQRFEFGGIFHLSEACNTSVSLLTSLNNAIECSSYSFPDGTVKRHPLFRVIFDDNTNGTGSAAGYKRNTLDLSTRNRFALFEWEHDLTLEKALQASLAASLKVDSAKLTQWQHTLLILRAAVKQLDMQMLVTMRDAMRGVQLLAMGFDLASTLTYATLGALSADDRELVKNAMKGQPNG